VRRRRQRLIYFLLAAPVLAVAAGLVLFAMRDSVVYFFGPTELQAKEVPPAKTVRVGGLVEEGSVRQRPDGAVRFRITDGTSSLDIEYRGLLPDLFREGQGIVATGALTEAGLFAASQVLAKHDETYMPPEVADMLKDQGHWKNQDQNQ